MKSINFKREIKGSLEQVTARVTRALQSQGFGVLTQIDFHAKIKEKLGKDIRPVIILGACNPKLAFDAYSANPDVTSLLPCNTVIREVSECNYSVEIAKPSALMEILGDAQLTQAATEADQKLAKALESI